MLWFLYGQFRIITIKGGSICFPIFKENRENAFNGGWNGSNGQAKRSDLPSLVSKLENDSKFITLEEVPQVDLSQVETLYDNGSARTPVQVVFKKI